MSFIKIEVFGGEMPSISPRALPPNGAQINRNLYTGINEFRPLGVDVPVSAASAGTKTLYRFSRDSTGEFSSNPAAGWITSTEERSYVKGQINDERTERTYLTIDDGSARPRVIDNTGQDRLLGVPKPGTISLGHVVTEEFTPDEADSFVFAELPASAASAVKAATEHKPEPGMRRNGSTIFAGPTSTQGMSFSDAYPQTSHAPWVLVASVPESRFESLAGAGVMVLGGAPGSGVVLAPLTCLPYAFTVDVAALKTALLAIEFPEEAGEDLAGTAVLKAAQIDSLAARIVDAFNPDLQIPGVRAKFDSLCAEFMRILTEDPVEEEPVKPVEPVKPTGPQYTSGGTTESPAWTAYSEAMTEFRSALADFEVDQKKVTASQTNALSRLATIQLEAEALTKLVEAAMSSAYKAVTGDAPREITAFVNEAGGVAGIVGSENIVDRIVDTRFYVVTFVTDWGEESAPSPVSDMLEVDQNDSVTIQRPAVSTGESYASRHIQLWRIYRSNVGTRSADFQFVDEVQIGTSSYTDTKKSSELGEVCPTKTWEQPPYRMDAQFSGLVKPVVGSNPFLRGLVGMPNGIMAGFFDNTVAFCDPYHPYAWPVEYEITIEYPVVGLGVFGQTLFVGTTGNPYMISGADSASMSAQKLEARQSCASRKSIASVQGGVLYASPDGLCLADANGVTIVSSGLYTREAWQKLNPSSMSAASHEDVYYLFYNAGSDSGCLSFDLKSKKLGRVDLSATAAFTDTLTDTLFVAHSGGVHACFMGADSRTGVWKTPLITFQKQAPLAWLKVYGDQTAETPVTVRWYGDGTLRYEVQVTSIKPVRLPAGRWLEHAVEISSKARVTRVVLTGDSDTLKSL